MAAPRQIEIRRLAPSDEAALETFFAEVRADPASIWFHPHPFDAEQARRILRLTCRDVYLGAFDEGARIVGYGMLRGFDEGWQVPSLGIWLAGPVRGTGLSRLLMKTLHEYARSVGAPRIRLRVYPGNAIAVRLYQSLGYVFVSEEGGQRVGLLELTDNENPNGQDP